MVNPTSNLNPSHATETPKPAAAPKAQPQQKSAPLPSDTVTLKSTGGVDHDSDRR